ncbi:MAG: hypothetical protein U0905_00280 [Pirellulales bacterium]
MYRVVLLMLLIFLCGAKYGYSESETQVVTDGNLIYVVSSLQNGVVFVDLLILSTAR